MKNIIKMAIFVCIFILFLNGCGDNNNTIQNSVVSPKVTEPIADRDYKKMSKDVAPIDYDVTADTIKLFADYAELIVDVTFLESLQDKKIEVTLPDGLTTDYYFKQYRFDLNEIIRNNDGNDFEGEFTLGVGGIISDAFPDIQVGDRVIIAIEKSEFYGDDDYYIWDNISLFYIKSDGTVFSAFEEDSKYDGYSVEELKKLITEQ